MFEKIVSDMKEAMKSQDKFKLSVIRMIKASIDKERIDKKIEITDDVVINILAKELKMREDSKQAFIQAERMDLVETLEKEIDIIKDYLPEALTEEEVDDIIDKALKDTNAASIKDMGSVMKIVSPLVKGRYDMKDISDKIKAKLC